MLSQHDRRTLADIEEWLSADDPDLAELLTRFGRWAPQRRRRPHRVTWCVVALDIALIAAAFALRSADPIFVSAVLLMLGAACWTVIAARALVRRRSEAEADGRSARRSSWRRARR